MSKENVNVMVVPASSIDEHSEYVMGIKANTLITGIQAIDIYDQIKLDALWLPRGEAETNECYRQVIPYTLICLRGTNQICVMRRGKGQGEARLHTKRYFGIGGHVEEKDGELEVGLRRELGEEFGFESDLVAHFQGVIIAHETPVDRVHVGLFHVLTTSKETFTNELEESMPKWVEVDDIESEEYYDELETWSKIIYDKYLSE